MGRKNRSFWESGLINNQTYLHHYNRLCNIAISRFEWKGLPDSVDPRFMELALFGEGVAVFFQDEVMGFLCLRVTHDGRWDVYNTPIDRTAYASNGYMCRLNKENSVLIWNNSTRTATRNDVEMFARKLYNLDRAIDVNANAQKTPILIACTEKERLSMLNLYKEYEGNEPVIYGDKQLNPKGISVLKTDAPFVGDRLFDLKTATWNEALTFLGIDNVSTVKKERLITEEAVRDSGDTSACRYSALSARQLACEQINKMFGLSVSCDFRRSDDIESLHNTSKDDL